MSLREAATRMERLYLMNPGDEEVVVLVQGKKVPVQSIHKDPVSGTIMIRISEEALDRV